VLTGVVLIAAGLVLPQMLFRMGSSKADILGDLLTVGFFIGLGLVLIGFLRNRRWQKEDRIARGPK
jgi:hypothetical protein